MAKVFDRNGFRVLGVAKKATDSQKIFKDLFEGDCKNPLADKLVEALRAKRAAEKAAAKAAKAAMMAAAADKRAKAQKESAENAQRLLAFARGLFFNPQEVEEILDPVEIGEVREGDDIDILFSELKKRDIEGEWEIPEDFFEGFSISKVVIAAMFGCFHNQYFPVSKTEFREKILKQIPFAIREAGRKRAFKKAGLTRVNLLRHYNVSPEAFLYAEEAMRKAGVEPSWDSYGVHGLFPGEIAKAWYAQGCKMGDKFRYFVTAYARSFAEKGRGDRFFMPLPRKGESFRGYMLRKRYEGILSKHFLSPISYGTHMEYALSVGDRKRLERLSNPSSIYYALKHCVVSTGIILHEEKREIFEEGTDGKYRVIRTEVDWAKLAQWLKLPKRVRAAELDFSLAWELLFNRKAPMGLGDKDPNPTVLLDRVTQRSFRQLMQIVKEYFERSSSKSYSALKANTKAAYHLAVIFRDIQSIKRWVAKIAGNGVLDVFTIHDAFVDANHFTNLKHKAGWVKMMAQFPELRWKAEFFAEFEKEFGRLPSGKREFEDFAQTLKYFNVEDKEVASIAAQFDLGQNGFESYQKFFKKHEPKRATMLPDVRVSEGDYTFRKLDDHDKVGPFLGLATDCCQHLHNAGSSCAKAGWRDPESGFYVVEKNGNIVAQSWAWRGKDGSLCFDSIEGLGGVNIETIAHLYQAAAKSLLGKLDINRVTVGDTSYGHTKKIKKILGGEKCKPAKMIKKVSYTDADDQWLLASAE